MRINLLSIFLLITAIISTCHAQDNTQVGLPEYAIARLGKGGINVMKFSPDGTQLAIGTTIGVWLYDVEDGNGKVLPLESAKYIDDLAFSSNGKILAVYILLERIIQLWNLETYNKLSALKIPDNYAPSEIVFSKDNKELIGLNMNGMIEWNIGTGVNRIKNIEVDTLAVSALDKSGRTFVIGDMRSGKIRQWNPGTESLGIAYWQKQPAGFERFLLDLFGREQDDKERKGLNVIALSPDGKTVASAHGDNKVRLWNTANENEHIGNERISLKGHTQMITVIAFSEDCTLLASGGEDSKIMLWDVRKGRKRATLTGHQGNIKTLAFSPIDNSLLASGGIDGTVRFWDTKKRKVQSVFATGHPEYVEDIVFSPDNTTLYGALSNGTIHSWNVQTGEEQYAPIVAQKNMFYEFDFSIDGTLFASHGAESTVFWDGYYSVIKWDNDKKDKKTKLLSLQSGDILAAFPHDALAVKVSPDNSILAANTRLNGVELWNIKTRKKMFGWIVEDSIWRKLLFSHDSKLLISYGHKTPTQVWNVTTKSEITPSEIKEANVIVLSPDGSLLALKHSDGVEIWGTTSTKLKKLKAITPKDFPIKGRAIVFAPDGPTLLGVSWIDRRSHIRLWDLDMSRDLGTLPSGHTSSIDTLRFSHDGKMLASASLDGTILLWDWQKIINNIKETKETIR